MISGSAVRRLRILAKLSEYQIELQGGISTSALGEIERGLRQPTEAEVEALKRLKIYPQKAVLP